MGDWIRSMGLAKSMETWRKKEWFSRNNYDLGKLWLRSMITTRDTFECAHGTNKSVHQEIKTFRAIKVGTTRRWSTHTKGKTMCEGGQATNNPWVNPKAIFVEETVEWMWIVGGHITFITKMPKQWKLYLWVRVQGSWATNSRSTFLFVFIEKCCGTNSFLWKCKALNCESKLWGQMPAILMRSDKAR